MFLFSVPASVPELATVWFALARSGWGVSRMSGELLDEAGRLMTVPPGSSSTGTCWLGAEHRLLATS